MTTIHRPAAMALSPTTRLGGRLLGALFVAQGLLALAPMAILGPAIGWPASLDNPPAEQLAAIAGAPQAVAAGYGVYLLYSVLVGPMMIALAARLLGGLQAPAAATVAVFAGLSVMARSIGILRWLTVMPVLALAWTGGDAAAKADLERVFLAVNEFGGGIGELLGVGLFMAIALGTLVAAAWRRGALPGWLAVLGMVSAALLAGLILPAVGVPVHVPMAAAVSTLSVWMLATGVWVFRRA
ncbi:MAG: DUF4386 domain-containing protein [Ideonella sp.]|jgi:hypothetical protein|nr:DUF4386 domain-containing protein [Ideonella sp.]